MIAGLWDSARSSTIIATPSRAVRALISIRVSSVTVSSSTGVNLLAFPRLTLDHHHPRLGVVAPPPGVRAARPPDDGLGLPLGVPFARHHRVKQAAGALRDFNPEPEHGYT